jgi:hypothetical protein
LVADSTDGVSFDNPNYTNMPQWFRLSMLYVLHIWQPHRLDYEHVYILDKCFPLYTKK